MADEDRGRRDDAARRGTAPGNRRPPIMADVARLAGVSSQTVSRVVNDQGPTSPATRQRVQEAIRQLGYRPNKAARALATTRSATIGVIGTQGGLWGPGTVHRSVESAARAAGYSVSSVSLETVSRSELTEAVEHLLNQHVEGVIMIAGFDEAVELAHQQDVGVPFVVVVGDAASARCETDTAQFEAARTAVRHLLDLGHVRVAHVAGPRNWVEARAREAGWRSALAQAGLRPAPPVRGDWSVASGYRAGQRIAAAGEATAVFAANDEMAVGVLRALAEAGLRVPSDVSLVGFDDIPLSAYLVPPLTTVRQDLQAVGRSAVHALRAAIGGLADPAGDPVRGPAQEQGPGRDTAVPPPQLQVRASTAPPPGPPDRAVGAPPRSGVLSPGTRR